MQPRSKLHSCGMGSDPAPKGQGGYTKRASVPLAVLEASRKFFGFKNPRL